MTQEDVLEGLKQNVRELTNDMTKGMWVEYVEWLNFCKDCELACNIHDCVEYCGNDECEDRDC